MFDFTEEQYFSKIRGSRVLIRGDRGEIENNTVRCLKDYKTPVEYNMTRSGSGIDEGLGAPVIEGIQAPENGCTLIHSEGRDSVTRKLP